MFALILAALPTLTSAWAIAFYTGRHCSDDTSFNNAIYYSPDDPNPSACMAAGEPGSGCQWYTDNGHNAANCTAPMDPQPGSFHFLKGTGCFIGTDTTDCLETQEIGDAEADHCWNFDEMYTTGSTIYFKCWDN